jgi:3-oxoacyl-[acyl-carrier protein] reductase
MEIRLDGKKALVTGSSLGLGKAMALAFARAGGDVAITARRPDILEQAKAEIAAQKGGKVFAYPADVSKAADCERLFNEASRDLGRIDILVNNAGQSRTGAFESLTDQIWQEDFDLKVFAAIRLARLALPAMKSRKWGRIINVLNIGSKAPAGGSAPTAVSRAAGLAITKILSHEGAAHNVLVNSLHVGIIESDQWAKRHRAQVAEGKNVPYEEFLAGMAKNLNLPMGRVGRSEEFANIALFLASDAASYINGTSINVDGGKSPVV